MILKYFKSYTFKSLTFLTLFKLPNKYNIGSSRFATITIFEVDRLQFAKVVHPDS